MASLLEQVRDPQAQLLLYLGNELPPGDRALLERRVAENPKLRQQLEELRSAEAAMQSSLAIDLGPSAATRSAALRSVSRSIRQWQVGRAVATPPRARERAPSWWAYTGTAAAVLMIGFLLWWAKQPDAGHVLPGEEVAIDVDEDLVVPDDATVSADPLLSLSRVPQIAEAEREILALQNFSMAMKDERQR